MASDIQEERTGWRKRQLELIEHRGEMYVYDGERLDRIPNRRDIALLELKAALCKHLITPVVSRINRLLLRIC